MLQECKGVLKQVALNGKVENCVPPLHASSLKDYKVWILVAPFWVDPPFWYPQILSFLYIYLP